MLHREQLTTLVVMWNDCKGSYESNYPTITTTTDPADYWMKHKQKAIFFMTHIFKEINSKQLIIYNTFLTTT